jgi:hypothetical protein
MKHVSLRQIGNSLYARIPIEWVRANKLKDNDLGFWTLVDGRTDKLEIMFVKLPIPPELQEAMQGVPEPPPQQEAAPG